MATTAGEMCATCATVHPQFAPCPDWRLREMQDGRKYDEGWRDGREALAAALREPPSRAMLNAMNMEVPTWDDDASRRKWFAGVEAFIKERMEER